MPIQSSLPLDPHFRIDCPPQEDTNSCQDQAPVGCTRFWNRACLTQTNPYRLHKRRVEKIRNRIPTLVAATGSTAFDLRNNAPAVVELTGDAFLDGLLQIQVDPNDLAPHDLFIASGIILADTLQWQFLGLNGLYASHDIVHLTDGREALRLTFSDAPIPVPLPSALALFPFTAGLAHALRRRFK
jgi:hypothetical protein